MGFLPCITSLEREKGRRGFLQRRKSMTLHSHTSKQADSPNAAMSHFMVFPTGTKNNAKELGKEYRLTGPL
jgi:hypothetical protein